MVCYIGVGSNLGDRLKNIKQALLFLKKIKGIKVNKCSPVYETQARGGMKDQRDYFNLVFEIDSALTPKDLLGCLKSVEKKVGRLKRKPRWASREIDLDILFYNDMVVKEEDLVIPHPLIQERFFVLKPLSDLAPFFKHPLLGMSAGEMLSALKKEGRWRRVDEEIIS